MRNWIQQLIVSDAHRLAKYTSVCIQWLLQNECMVKMTLRFQELNSDITPYRTLKAGNTQINQPLRSYVHFKA